MSGLQCIFKSCADPREGKINRLKKEQLEEILKILKIRRKFNLKYADLEFLEEISESDGYHRDCRKNFIHLSADYFGKYRRYEEGKNFNYFLILIKFLEKKN